MNRKRVSSAGSIRSGDDNHSMILQGTIMQLQHELTCCRSEKEKVTNQLSCLIMMVKKAWTGDTVAARHVANIVGISPPDFKEGAAENEVFLTAMPKPRVLNNWAKLCIGLLNQEYRRQEVLAAEKQAFHLQRRHDYLEEQLYHQSNIENIQTLPRSTSSLYRPGSSAQKKTSSRPPSGKRSVGHLYRPLNEQTGNHVPAWPGLLVEPAIRNAPTSKTKTYEKSVYRLSSVNGDQMGEDTDLERTHVRYDDCNRYTEDGIYEVKSLFGRNLWNKKRPISASQQKLSDSRRSRPKSAVVQNTGRSLKYETTRPVSASPNVKSTYNGQREECLIPTSCVSNTDNATESTSDTSMGNEVDAMQAEYEAMTIKTQERFDQYGQDVKKMEDMQDDFMKTTLSLQKKLGIPEDGLIY